MAFTSEDLKRLKEIIGHDLEGEVADDAAVWILNQQKDLIERLEAAEWACKRADALGECIAEFPKDFSAWGEHIEALDDAVDAWRKSCGK